MNNKYWKPWRVSEVYKEGDSFGTARLEKQTVNQIMALQAMMGAVTSGIRNVMQQGDTATRLIVGNGNGSTLWMSDSKDEFLDHLAAIQDARGRVLVHGLGLGCFLRCILSKEEVTHVDVVEKDFDILGLITPYFQTDYQKGRVTFHHNDAYYKRWPKGTRWDYVWHDIWPTICLDDLADHTKLKRKFQNRCSQQAAWKDRELKNMQRREKANPYRYF